MKTVTYDLLDFSFCRHFLVNSADRIVRVYDSQEVIACGKNGEPEPLQKLQDLVNRYVNKKIPVIFE